MSLRCLKNRVLLFPAPTVTQSQGGIFYPESFHTGADSNTRFWVAAIGPEVKDLKIGDHVICVMPPEEHARLEGGARVLDAKHIVAKLE